MKILYIKHIDIEGPETLGDFFASKGFASQIIEMGIDDTFPEDLSDIAAVVGLGGPMNVYEESKYAFLAKEDGFLKRVIAQGIPYLGLCLGSQLLAKAAGARVVKSPQEEIGWYNVQLTSQGEKDPLFKGLESELEIFHWHGDMFLLPEDGFLLARAEGCPHQAFRVGSCAYGLQFHMEITDQSIQQWSEKYAPEQQERAQAMLADYKHKKESFNTLATQMYENFLEIIHQHRLKD